MSSLKKTDHFYLIDGSGYIFRAYYALPPLSRKSDGLPTGAVSGFCSMLFKLLELQAGLYGVPQKERITDIILKMVALEKQADSYARSLSGGMKRRLLIAKAMVHQPPILVLDEPTAGVDVELRKNLWENVKALNKEGVTIILTTHYLFEAQEMCDRIAIIDKGNLVALDTTQKLLDRIQTKKITFKVSEGYETKDLALSGVKFDLESNNSITAIYEKNSYKFDDVADVLKKITSKY